MTNATRRPLSDVRIVSRRRREGFTLLEAVTAMAVVSLLAVGLGSAMLLAGRALPEARSLATQTMTGAATVEQVAAELQYAISINQRSERMIEFTVADRDNNGAPEVIRYEWSGVAGASLTRQYNGGTATDVLANVRDFGLSYDLQDISQTIPQGNESPETLLISYDCSTDYKDYTIRDTELYSEYFRPTLPADAVSWKVTRVRFYAKQSGLPGGETKVQLQTPTAGGLPSGVVLEERTFHESLLPLLYLMQEMTYTQACNLSPQQGLCLVFRWVADAEACKLLGRDKNVTTPNLALLKSTDRTVSWSTQAGQSLLFWVYGTVTTAGTPQIQHTYYVNAISLRLQPDPDDLTTVQTSVRVLNRPQVTQ